MIDRLDNVDLKAMTVRDIPDVQIIERSSFPTPWSFQAFVSELEENENAHYLVARISGRVVGYIGLWIIIDEGHITNVAVDPGYRSRGIGRLLLEAIASFAYKRGVRKMTLEVRVSNTRAQALYEKIGYRSYGIRKGYYRDSNEDAIIMWMDLVEGEPHA